MTFRSEVTLATLAARRPDRLSGAAVAGWFVVGAVWGLAMAWVVTWAIG